MFYRYGAAYTAMQDGSRYFRRLLHKMREEKMASTGMTREQMKELFFSSEQLQAMSFLTPSVSDALLVLDYYRAHNPDVSDTTMPEKLAVAYWSLLDKDTRKPATLQALSTAIGVAASTVKAWLASGLVVELADRMACKHGEPAIRRKVLEVMMRELSKEKVSDGVLKLAAEMVNLKGHLAQEETRDPVLALSDEERRRLENTASASSVKPRPKASATLKEGAVLQMVK